MGPTLQPSDEPNHSIGQSLSVSSSFQAGGKERARLPAYPPTPVTATALAPYDPVPYCAVFFITVVPPVRQQQQGSSPIDRSLSTAHSNAVWNFHRCLGPSQILSSPSSSTGNRALNGRHPLSTRYFTTNDIVSQVHTSSKQQLRPIGALTVLSQQAQGLKPKARGAV
jgi:hypothetical protein